MDKRLFFVASSNDTNEEIFETLSEAEKFFETIQKEEGARIEISIVKHAYKDNGQWTYKDLSDTFKPIVIVWMTSYDGELIKMFNA